MLSAKKTGFILVNNDPFFGNGITAAVRKQFPKNDKIVFRWFDCRDSAVKSEVQKYTKQTGRYLVQVEVQ